MNRIILYFKKSILLLLITLEVFYLSSCNTPHQAKKYNIGMGISYSATDVENSKIVILTIRHEADVSFPLEIGLLKNFIPTPFSVVQGHETIQNMCFRLNLSETNGALITQQLELRLNDCSEQDDLILWFANRKTISDHDLNGYRFLRLNSGNRKNFPDAVNLQWNSTERDPNLLFSLYPTSVIQHENDISIDFIFSPEMLYDGGWDLTKEDPELMVDFLLIAMDGERLIPFKTSNYMMGSVPVKENVQFHVELNWTGKHGDSLSFFLIPFPCLDYNNSNRLQKVIYNSSTHFTITI